MNIALDFDDTYTRDPKLWTMFVESCLLRGHDIRIVTMRNPEMGIDTGISTNILPVMYTSGEQKRKFCDEIEWQPDVWIDDSPEFIVREDVFKFVKAFKG